MPEKSKILIVLGPTASGKSGIATALAKKFNGEIISADSRQVYKGLNIGTGKITKKEMRGMKHHLLDVTNPKKRFTVSEYINLANRAIAQIINGGKLPIVCGGTGFYIDALLGDKQIPEAPPNQKLREKLEKKSVDELFEILKKLDPERAKTIDKQNTRRLIRAIEICKALGKVPPLRQGSAGQAKYEVLKIGINIPEIELKNRINKRIEKWFKGGLLKEVLNLHKKSLSWKRMSEIGLEYKIVSLFLQNKLSKEEMIKRMQIETHQYAKRQMTWFKRDKNTIWLPPKISLIEKEVKRFLKK
ncbi:MAG: tRNA (adenosine(37)-N6)-dimethylallyltransferase MiaA [Candidatus Zambryskibacteria bacterium RIFCSPHIGHO2_12_FULL_38_34]|nr:MAG: tRNA (adenosine(37)-N6)-dimethylallyltransferase MiaA [Candidatus Zambryskibacteria bacterium RIFCSPHIGHO2_12_FULL_38_34]OHB08749.1 MAG: tRNA (adenosine(37)-N6)-dimethylallyltransferase MiaA [Candidatus Zambryskibacteria bacterium RIFCSPLOWO2_02_FULL_38_13]